MFDLDISEGAWYDEKAKVWHGAKFQHFYDRNASVGRILFEEMRKRPKSICQISVTERTSLTNEEALLHAIRLAEWFRSQGFKQSDIIGVAARNTTHLMTLVLACFFNGIALHAVNPVREKKLITDLFDSTKPKLIFFDGHEYEKIKGATLALEAKLCTLSNHLPNVQSILELLQPTGTEKKFAPATLENGPEQTLIILCTSGTSGLPKAVTISNNKRLCGTFPFLTSKDTLFVLSTIDWLSGIIYFIDSIVAGAKRIITDQAFNAEYFLKVVSEFKATFAIIAPPLLTTLLNSPAIDADKLDTLQYLVIGGGKCTTRTQQRIQNYLRHGRMINVYAFSEFGRVVAINYDLRQKPQSVGRVQPGHKVKILNENGEQVGCGEIGEICCNHGEQWLGYYRNSAVSAEMCDADGWFHTGDLGYFDADGYLSIVDRKKDIFKYKGMQYSPHEILEVIVKMPDVVDACVFGLWNEEEGDAAAAVVAGAHGSSLSARDVIDYVKEHIEVDYKHLHAGAVVVKELPKLPNGKQNVEEIKKLFISERSDQEKCYLV
ncbi:PREDICTED: luciferin 4-monooxygenase-like isoform X1 [Rhagoletis zephyria]|uniref:luciferin 4-monooxygenase-like isoform X1 n=2 Tax=Rhagoletis zephyria TaxID=28612 RepID=UPI000811989A|nr:PREDICTED: luciferin 4-monooxygenase-like isoform X1 [Rhagoletis zephyria]XP_017488005.1 PREDICTED: luciferin 4-monooxygenase-like isoform X1 [Rhagoletis zephyria]